MPCPPRYCPECWKIGIVQLWNAEYKCEHRIEADKITSRINTIHQEKQLNLI